MGRLERVKTPCYIVDEKKLRENLEILKRVQEEAGCKILLAQKAFSMFRVYPLIGEYLAGTTGSGLFEARLGYEEMGKENHVFAPAYKAEEMEELDGICDHIVFNSFSQFETHKAVCRHASIGLRVNPEYSTQKGCSIYDPCAPSSRLGITKRKFLETCPDRLPKEVEGLHFHTLCEQNAEDLADTFQVFEKNFSHYFSQIKWLNLGGGQHITRPGYHLQTLINLIRDIRKRYGLEVYLEPGEAVALDAGYLVTEVLDMVKNGIQTLILDTSAACHMPDVLEMPYRPPLRGGYKPWEKPFTYRLSSVTCLAGDTIGDYSFEGPVWIGDQLVFEDMAIYSMVKNNTFNGMPLPDIALRRRDGSCEMVRRFGYEDFKGRLS